MFLSQRVLTLMAQPPAPVVPPEPLPPGGRILMDGLNLPDDVRDLPQAPPSAPQTPVETSTAVDVPQGLGEAPASVNCHITVAGRQVQLTLRDSDEGRLLERLQAVLAQFPVAQASREPQAPLSPQQHALAMHRPITQTGWCAVHNVEMKLNDKHGRQWWSHRTAEGQWCKGR
jgi:hypothetical protein